MRLLEELMNEHDAILEMLQQVIDLGIVSAEADAALRAVKAQLLAHLKKENDELYPVLRRAARTDKELDRLLQASGRELEAVYGMAFRFFEKYAAGGAGKEFARDLGTLYAALKARILEEERTLLQEYEKRMPLNPPHSAA
jgi:hemerythrin-like domain-containing protein